MITPVLLSYEPTPETLQVMVSDAAALAEAVQVSLPYSGSIRNQRSIILLQRINRTYPEITLPCFFKIVRVSDPLTMIWTDSPATLEENEPEITFSSSL